MHEPGIKATVRNNEVSVLIRCPSSEVSSTVIGGLGVYLPGGSKEGSLDF